MHLTQKVLPLKTMIQFSIALLALTLPFAWYFWSDVSVKSYVAGYVLCCLNLWALTYLGSLIVHSVASNKKVVKHIKGLTIVLGLVKFFFFIVSLFILIALLEYSAIHIFLGSLLALSVSAAFMSYTFLDYLKELRHDRELKHAELVAQRLRAEKVGS